VDAALDWMQGVGDQPFGLWVHLFDPHGPYLPPPPWDTAYYEGDPRDPAHDSMEQVSEVATYLERSLQGITDLAWVQAQYAGEVSYADEQLGRLLNGLESLGHDNDTLVVVAGDHGESLGEHGVWFDHGDDLSEAATRVPLLFQWPGHLEAGAVVDHPVELTDVAPTISSLLGLSVPTDSDGISLVRWMIPDGPESGPVRPFSRAICFDRQANLTAREQGTIERPTYRMVALRDTVGRLVSRESEDSADRYYIVDEQGREHEAAPPGNTAQDMAAMARNLLSGMTDQALERSTTELDPTTRARLEALGYVE
ncbi:MAG: sulfatase-like hydrolase/transferase, partial [Myxococcota bacterium]|nr:sulfatase-like hydrolase/transferase [Myxococcota bacterium]